MPALVAALGAQRFDQPTKSRDGGAQVLTSVTAQGAPRTDPPTKSRCGRAQESTSTAAPGALQTDLLTGFRSHSPPLSGPWNLCGAEWASDFRLQSAAIGQKPQWLLPPVVWGTLNGIKVRMLVDTGAAICLVTRALAQRLQLEIEPTTAGLPLAMANGKPGDIDGTAEVICTVGSRMQRVTV